MNKHLVLLGVIILLICVGLSGCNAIIDDESNDFIGGDDSQGIETVSISGVEVTQTINKPDKEVILSVSGVDNDITVTKETNLIKVILSGVDNIVRVSRSHSFTSSISGVGTEIVYYD